MTEQEQLPVEESGLKRGLKTRHLTMMGLGSAIGAGLFLGTGVGIQAAGPAVIIAYIIAGAITVLIMQMLAEMVAARPSAGSFSTYAEQAFGPWGGFSVGWLYWFMMIMIMGAEMTGASAIMAGWFGIAPWIPALVAVLFFTVVNLAAVRGYGEFEFWFSLIKVAVIAIFLVIGILLIFGLLPAHDPVWLSNIEAVGFMPNGFAGVATALLAVAFAFGGIELVTIAAAESENPKDSVNSAMRSIIWRISVFYIGSVLVIILLLPFNEIAGSDSAADSPFTQVLSLANIPGIVGIMEVVIALALLSAFNAQLYGSSRLLYALAHQKNAPKMFGKTNHQGVPVRSVLVSVFFAFVSVGLQWWNPPGLLAFLLNAVGGCLIVIWFAIIFSYVRLHPQLERSGEITEVRMWGYPWLPWVTAAVVAALVILMLTDPAGRVQVISVSVLVAFIVVCGLVVQRSQKSQ
ncbi:amino acid permease [Corynebacterium breve]|uniref:Amino acid permease n=1 Tax=Corynebacterium breve TaxID=3049799 RepID=A0ABY8VGW3_9CORY|nr:amino acid permease [Corynebacterium breve]WIM68562.1 amino acid permease [Corynebacterium breve]